MDNHIVVEYESLRQEISQKTTIYTTLVMGAFPIIVTIATFIMKSEKGDLSSLVLIGPFVLIFLVSLGMTHCKYSIAKLSAYIIVFLEGEDSGLKWESRNRFLAWYGKKNRVLSICTQFACTVLSAFYFVVYVIYCGFKWTVVGLFLFVLWELCLAIIMKPFDRQKEEWIRKWRAFKLCEPMLCSLIEGTSIKENFTVEINLKGKS